MKIILVQHKSYLNGTGGAEKMCSFLANGFLSMGHEVEIATNEDIVGKAMFPLDAQIKVTNIFRPEIFQVQLKTVVNYRGKNPIKWVLGKIKKKSARAFNKKLAKKYEYKVFEVNLRHRAGAWKSYFEQVKPHLVITTSLSSALEVTYTSDFSFPIVNSVNGRPDYDYTSILGERDPQEETLLKDTFTKLTAVQVLFDSYKSFLPEAFRGSRFVISNPVPQVEAEIMIDYKIPKKRYTISHIARLDNGCKQQSVAIEVFSKLAPDYPDWDLEFWGEGQDADFLQNIITKKGLSNRVFLKGFTDKPLDKLKEAAVFIFPSKYEGFGLALAEAMTLGLPVLGFKSCSGVNELIQHGENGFLAENVEELTHYLKVLMDSPSLRQEMGQHGVLAMRKYAPEAILKQWELLIDDVVKEL